MFIYITVNKQKLKHQQKTAKKIDQCEPQEHYKGTKALLRQATSNSKLKFVLQPSALYSSYITL